MDCCCVFVCRLWRVTVNGLLLCLCAGSGGSLLMDCCCVFVCRLWRVTVKLMDC